MRSFAAKRVLFALVLLARASASRAQTASSAPWAAPESGSSDAASDRARPALSPPAPPTSPSPGEAASSESSAAPSTTQPANATVAPPSAAPPAGAHANAPVTNTDPREHYGTTPDPAFTHNFQLPSARPLHQGDTMLTVMGATGWLGVRYGFTRRFDMGAGIPYYAAGVGLDARYAFVLGDHTALALYANVSIPFLPGGNDPGAFFGFTWQGAGAAWLLGPVVSVWGPRAGIHVGAHIAERVLLGGLWGMIHVTLEARVMDSVKAIAQGVIMAEMVDEQSPPGATRQLIGNGQPRVHPYLVLGARVHSRRFAVDFGALMSFAADAPLAGGVPGIWPWAAVCQTF